MFLDMLCSSKISEHLDNQYEVLLGLHKSLKYESFVDTLLLKHLIFHLYSPYKQYTCLFYFDVTYVLHVHIQMC